MSRKTTVARITLIVALLGLSACVSTPQSTQLLQVGSEASPFTKPVLLTEVAFFPQEKFQCGPAALATVLRANQVSVTPDELVPRVYLAARQGSLQIEMLAAARRYQRIAYVLPPSLTSVLKEVQQGRPVLVMQNLGLGWYPRWHYAVVVGYDLSREELILNSGKTEHYRVAFRLFERTWQRANHWAMVVLTPGELPVDADELSYLDALAALERTTSVANHAPVKEEVVNIEAAYTAGLQRWPNSAMLAVGLGNVFYHQGRKQAAAKQFARALKYNPGYAPAHNNLAQVLLELGDKINAKRHAQTAVTLGGDYREISQATLDAIGVN